MYVFLCMWRVLLSLPAALLWMLLYGLIVLGWGIKAGDRFIVCWNSFVEEADFQLPIGDIDEESIR